MKKRSQLLLLLFLLALPFRAAQAQAQTVLSVSPSSTTLQAGQSATLAVRITDVQNLYAYDITLHYDPSIIEVTSIDNGSFLNGGFTAAQILDKTAGTAQLAFTSIPPFNAQSGSGELATFKLKAKAGGSARISIENIQLMRKDATAISATSTSGQVTVSGGAAVTEAPRPGANPGGNDSGQPLDALNPGAAVSSTQSAPAVKPTKAPGGQTQPTTAPTQRSTVVPAAQVADPEPEKNGGIPPLVWMIPAALILLAGGYFGGNFLRDRTQKKK
jgi:hypothetical protein